MKRFPRFALLIACIWTLAACQRSATLCTLMVNAEVCPQGVDVDDPVFSWITRSEETGQGWSSFRVVVSDSKKKMARKIYLYDSGKIPLEGHHNLQPNGLRLLPCTRYYWSVIYYRQDQKEHRVGQSWFETGLMSKGFESARWIGSRRENMTSQVDDYIIDFDFCIDAEDYIGTFLFSVKDSLLYNSLTVDLAKGPQIRLKRVRAGAIISKIEAKVHDLGKGVHHVKLISNLASTGKVSVELDGAEVLSSASEVPDAARTVQSFRYGFLLTGGQSSFFSNINIFDTGSKTVLHSNPSRIDVREGDPPVLINPCAEYSAPMIKKSFYISKEIERAKLYSTALGLYELHVNGQKLGGRRWEQFKSRDHSGLGYEISDLTSLLKRGKNSIGVVLGRDGDRYGHASMVKPVFLAFILVEYADGTREKISTDGTWRCYDHGPVIEDGIGLGECYDARQEVSDWTDLAFSEDRWDSVSVFWSSGFDRTLFYTGGNRLEVQVILPIGMYEDNGKYVYDFGETVYGSERISGMMAETGHEIRIELFESTIDGSDYTMDCYTFRGDPAGESFSPVFSFHKFRYLAISGLSQPLPLNQISAEVLAP